MVHIEGRITPEQGKVYKNKGGRKFLCIRGYNGNAVMQNVVSRWTFKANGVILYEDGTIEWDYSTGGHFGKEVESMLVIKTPFGDFGHPKDLLHYMKDEGLAEAHVKVQYCFEDVFEKNMSFDDVSRWVRYFIRPISSTLEEAIEWLRLGGA